MAYEYLKEAKPAKAEDLSELRVTVADLIQQVKVGGDQAVYELAKKFDKIDRRALKVTEEEFYNARKEVPLTLKEDINFGINQIRNFAKAQRESLSEFEAEIYPGIHLGHRLIPVENVGTYVPGGRYPILSAAQMLIVPAKVAGSKRVIACTPPRSDGKVHPAVLYAAQESGVDDVYCIGGVQAIAAMAYGTETIKPVDIIAGPGNKWVTEAKRQVNGIVGLDLQAGPSEILIIADETGEADIIAADLLGQLEHDPNARCLLATTSRQLAVETIAEVEKQLSVLSTADVARVAWENQGEVVVVSDLNEAAHVANDWAPEHLEIHTKYPKVLLPKLTNYGAAFLGVETAEVFADKVAGTNHTLPTARAARYTGGVWVGTFLKWLTHQWVSQDGMKLLAEITVNQSTIEGMAAHAESAAIRLRKMK
ncbi:MAG: histidinol dehydrogenase [Acidaminobacter sp.]|jgi:histidinol dehydrogenase/sulfopropanediol 3-dehydrogenase|uniref:histidinol dehydrogenase n=1 Tax=Acidaminobacter sp. TaxID=1872102 RepID=UPI0013851EDB|nr:histidinol dehydrogenase [Acidaminobacter sp.]MZQ99256.1 histidinol dehydrogenase [Acidaminobacter sp.]